MPAPRGAIQQVGLVLKKLDPTSPPNYTNEFFRDREQLSKDVEACVRVMADPGASDGWCALVADIWNLATLTNAYFDIGQTTNPALDDFKKDWDRIKKLCACP